MTILLIMMMMMTMMKDDDDDDTDDNDGIDNLNMMALTWNDVRAGVEDRVEGGAGDREVLDKQTMMEAMMRVQQTMMRVVGTTCGRDNMCGRDSM